MPRTLAPADVARLAELVGLRFPTEDLGAVAEALAAHLAFVAPLLHADLDDVDPSLSHDPRWHD
jgi:hypothetical protein